MSSYTGAGSAPIHAHGVHAVDWGLPADEPVFQGMSWQWQGRAVRLDRGSDALRLGPPLGTALARRDQRHRARDRSERLLEPIAPPRQPDSEGFETAPRGGLLLTDGRQLYPARLVRAHGQLTLVFDPFLPPPGIELWVVDCDAEAASGLSSSPAPSASAGTGRASTPGGFLAGTRIATPRGPVPVESLTPGDLVLTRDCGALPVLWIGETRLTEAEILAAPHLRPLRLAPDALGPARPSAPLRLAPGHRLVIPAMPGFWGEPEALARVSDLEDGRLIRRDLAAGSLRYLQILLPRHAILDLEGIGCESFHPGLADAASLRWHARSLERALPGISRTPQGFGETALRCLDRAEAAIARRAA